MTDASSTTGNLTPAAVSSTRQRVSTAGQGRDWLFAWTSRLSVWFSIFVLGLLLVSVTWESVGWLNWQFLTSFDSSRRPEQAGIFAGLLGSIWLMLLTILFSVPLGVGAAIYLEEYAPPHWLTRLIQVNLANLAGVPSIVYGILGFNLFVRMFGLFDPQGAVQRMTGFRRAGLFWSEEFGGYIIPLPPGPVLVTGALTMSLLILPVIIIASQEALRAVPASLRHASLALGASKWQTVRHQVLPAALPGIMTGVILAISRALGETAPLVVLGVATFVTFAPGNIDSLSALVEYPAGLLKVPFDQFTAIPLQIFNWTSYPSPDFRHVAAAGIMVLLSLLLVLNGLAILIRYRAGRHHRS